ncbi:LRR receptor-like serine/threonine-protein kinase IOS1 [Vitis vinifera]|uniref:LRR receptor-like serine/threonine-protein kinase IOS1 n=1 Tax=Vitis vinifera TaxID=29760 RepID=A0A438EWA3_VITVI|nr:LRR receptor-like serine/threonine-protein kinase IOS1 [Vitis vinifera]
MNDSSAKSRHFTSEKFSLHICKSMSSVTFTMQFDLLGKEDICSIGKSADQGVQSPTKALIFEYIVMKCAKADPSYEVESLLDPACRARSIAKLPHDNRPKEPKGLMDKFEGFPFALLGIFILILLAHAQDQSGFISIDCGLAEDSSYYDEETHIYYTSDATFIDTGVSKNIAPEFKTSNFLKQFVNVRSFPEGIKNCYTIRPARGKGFGTPFISVLELRLLNNTIYTTASGSLVPYWRPDFGSPKGFIRFDDDAFDRFWFPYNSSKWAVLSTSLTIDANSRNRYQPPSIVMRTAATPLNAGEHLEFSWEPSDPTTQFYVYMHFAEVEELKVNQSREFNIFLNGT